MAALVDLRSDTVTLPSAGMRKAMSRAKVGDSQRGEDPSVRALEEYAASLFRKE
ncbi:MAG TPA: beta-eliminating lyase-related protein, partial [Candidatus Bathyarchaeia archaeon]|nr:beta-eliminating lyase-related protein [Candidatus Bathyarchaeia archaeon]